MMDSEEIEDLTSQIDDHIAQGYGTKLQLRQRKADEAYRYSLYRRGLQKANAVNNLVTGVGNRFPNDSVYDRGISVYDLDRGINTYRDEQQSDLLAVGNIALHGAAAFGSAAAMANPYGLGAYAISAAAQLLYNAVDDKDDSPIAWLTDNAFTKVLGGANDLLTEYTPAYTADSDKEGMSSMMGFNGLDALATGIGYLTGGQFAAKGVAKMMGEGSKFYELVNKTMGGKGLGLTAEGMASAGATAAQEADKIAKAKKFTDGVSGLSGTIVGRLGESLMERYGTKQEMLQNGYSEEEANRAADMNFLGNMALSSVDYLQNIKMLGTFDKIFPKLATPVGKYGERATEYFNEGLKQVRKYDKAKDILAAFGKNAVLEGGEEGLQYAFNKGSQDTVAEGGDWLDFLANTGNELGKSFTTTEGQMSWILGGLMGGGMSALHTGLKYNTPKELNQIWKDYNDLKTDLDENYKVNENGLYTEYNEGGSKTKKVINQDYIDTLNSNSQLEAIKEYAKGKNDEVLYNAAQKKQVLNKTLFNLSIGQYDTFKNQLENTDMTLDEFKAIKALQENKKLSEIEVTPEDLIKYKKESAESLKIAEEFKNSYKTASNLPGFHTLSKDAMMKFGEILSSQKAIESQLKTIRPELLPALEEYSAANTELAFPEDGRKTKTGKPDMRTKENKETVANNALATVLDNFKDDPLQQEVLKDQYEKYKELNVANKKLLEQYKEALKNPASLEQAVTNEKLEDFKRGVEQVSTNYKKLRDLHVQRASKSKPGEPFTIQVTDKEGNVKEYTTRLVDGVHKLINLDDNSEVDVDTLGDNYVVAKSNKEASTFEELEDEYGEEEFDEEEKARESSNPYQDYDAKKQDFFSSTGSIWRFIVNLVNGKEEKELDENGDFVINTQNEEISKYMANPENTPSDSKVYSWQLEVDENVSDDYLLPILKEVNERRALTQNLRPLTLEQLKSDPAHRLVKMTLYKNGKKVYRNTSTGQAKPITCFMHDVDYFYRTAEYDRLTKNPDPNLTDSQQLEQITKAFERLKSQRQHIVDSILKAGSPLYAPVISKSTGILSRLPYVNGVRPKKNIIGRVVKELKSLIEHKSILPDENGNMKLMPGIGVVTAVDNIDSNSANITITYLAKDGLKNKTTSIVDSPKKYFKGQVVFNDVQANGEPIIETPFVKGTFSNDDMNGLIDALHYFVNKKSNKITIDGKEYNLFSSKFLGKPEMVKSEDGTETKAKYEFGIIDALINVYNSREGKYKNSINVFVDNVTGDYILKLGQDKLVLKTNEKGEVEEVPREKIERFFTNAYPKGFKYQFKYISADKFKDGFAFPSKVNPDGTAEGSKANSYLEFMFDGEDPRIGTDVSKDFKYVNSYMSLGMTADGKNVALSINAPESAPTKQNQPQAKPQPQSQPKSQPKPDTSQPAPKPQANVRTEESVFNNLVKESKEGKTTTFDSLSTEGKMYLLKQLHSNSEFDALLYYDAKVTNDEFNQITKKYGITDFNTSILDQLASDPEKHNEFVNNLTFVGPEIIKSQDEVQDDVCNGTTADINTNSPVVDAKPKIDPNNYFDDLGDF